MKEINEEEKKLIPYGDYCYKIISVDKKTGRISTNQCPFMFLNKHDYWDCKFAETLNGEGDYLDLLLDDQCKCCGVNLPDESEYLA